MMAGLIAALLSGCLDPAQELGAEPERPGSETADALAWYDELAFVHREPEHLLDRWERVLEKVGPAGGCDPEIPQAPMADTGHLFHLALSHERRCNSSAGEAADRLAASGSNASALERMFQKAERDASKQIEDAAEGIARIVPKDIVAYELKTWLVDRLVRTEAVLDDARAYAAVMSERQDRSTVGNAFIKVWVAANVSAALVHLAAVVETHAPYEDAPGGPSTGGIETDLVSLLERVRAQLENGTLDFPADSFARYVDTSIGRSNRLAKERGWEDALLGDLIRANWYEAAMREAERGEGRSGDVEERLEEFAKEPRMLWSTWNAYFLVENLRSAGSPERSSVAAPLAAALPALEYPAWFVYDEEW